MSDRRKSARITGNRRNYTKPRCRTTTKHHLHLDAPEVAGIETLDGGGELQIIVLGECAARDGSSCSKCLHCRRHYVLYCALVCCMSTLADRRTSSARGLNAVVCLHLSVARIGYSASRIA